MLQSCVIWNGQCDNGIAAPYGSCVTVMFFYCIASFIAITVLTCKDGTNFGNYPRAEGDAHFKSSWSMPSRVKHEKPSAGTWRSTESWPCVLGMRFSTMSKNTRTDLQCEKPQYNPHDTPLQPPYGPIDSPHSLIERQEA